MKAKLFFYTALQWVAVLFTFAVYLIHKTYSLPIFWEEFPRYTKWLQNNYATLVGLSLVIITAIFLLSSALGIIAFFTYLAARIYFTWKHKA